MDKSSFSSWLHTAAGGLTCHRRIQPLIHLCFPQVFLNFTHRSRATTEREPGFLSAQKACAWPVQPKAMFCDLRATKSPVSFDCSRRKRNLSFPNAGAFVHLPVLLGVTSTSLSFFHFSLFLRTLPKSTATPPPRLSACPSASQRSCACPFTLFLSLTEQSGLSIYLGGPPFGPKHP